MNGFSKEQSASREKTLATSLLLSAPGPLVTAIALFTSHSTTQLADFLRRGVELVAVFIGWWVFRCLHRAASLDEAAQARLQRLAGLSTAGAMACSGVILLAVAFARLSAFEPGGNVIAGLVIALLGLLTNGWFWRRYSILVGERHDPVIAAQQQLYRAKTTVDLCVTIALAAVAIAPAYPATRYVDLLGSAIVAIYLLWSGLRAAQKHSAVPRPDAKSTERHDAPIQQPIAWSTAKFSMDAKILWLSRVLTQFVARMPTWVWGILNRVLIKPSRIPAGIQVTDSVIDVQAQTSIRLRIYRPRVAPAKVPALLWMHGGGYMMGTPEQDDAYIIPFVEPMGLVVVSVDYRLAPGHPFPAALEDCYAALQWLAAHAARLGCDPARIAIGGDSAGAGLAAALAQLAHDRGGIQPVFQLLVYPMLDDRTAAREDIDPQAHLVWNNISNRSGWEAYLHQPCGAETAPAGSVPARRLDLAGLPPAWIGVGTHDLFYDEALIYARRLHEAGVACELVIAPGAFHGFDLFAPETEAVKDFRRAQVQALQNALVE